MNRTNRLEAALNNVEKLLDGHIASMKKATAAAKKPAAKKAAKAKTPAKKAAPTATKKPAAKKSVKAAAPAAKPTKGAKVKALSKPNLMKLKRLIDRGALDVEELIAAIVEALRSQRVKTPVVGGVAQVLRNALAELDVIDVADYVEAPGSGGFGPGLVPMGD